jgi:hypothetical protein
VATLAGSSGRFEVGGGGRGRRDRRGRALAGVREGTLRDVVWMAFAYLLETAPGMGMVGGWPLCAGKRDIGDGAILNYFRILVDPLRKTCRGGERTAAPAEGRSKGAIARGPAASTSWARRAQPVVLTASCQRQPTVDSGRSVAAGSPIWRWTRRSHVSA